MNYLAWRRNIYHEQRTSHPPSNSVSLLLTSRQISTETQTVLGRLKIKSDYALDISVLNDIELYPTWVYIPHTTNRVSTLKVDVRLFGHIISEDDASSQGGDGGIVGLHWEFYALLERFLRYGPVGAKKGKSPPKEDCRNPTYNDYDVSVETLILDFQSAESTLSFPPEGVLDHEMWTARHENSPWQHRHGIPGCQPSDYTSRPEWFAKYLSRWIHEILDLDYHTALYGMKLYERIGKFRIQVNGELKEEIRLADKLASLRFTDPRETFGHLTDHQSRVPVFWSWKKWTLEKRRLIGLPVVWPRDPELM